MGFTRFDIAYMRMTSNNYIGTKYGVLTISDVYRKDGKTYADCVCECGQTKNNILLLNLKKGKSSCGKCQYWNKFKYNEDFFNKSSPQRNYTVGLIASDGTVERNGNRMTLTLKEEDSEILYKLNSYISDSNLVSKKNIKCAGQQQYKLRISNKSIIKQLGSLGIHPNKSRSFCVPDFLKDDCDFWRGMIDGDGFISFNDDKLSMGICGTLDVCDKFLEFCKNYSTSTSVKPEFSSTNKNFGRCKIHGTCALTIGNILYKNFDGLAISRKYNNFKRAVIKHKSSRKKKMDEVFMNMASGMASLSYAVKAKVGVIIVDKDLNIISSAYNGTPAGFDNTAEYVLPDGLLKTKPETLHAETNAIAKLAKSTMSSKDSTMYITLSPCLQCAKLIIQAGVKKVFYRDIHIDHDGMDGINLLKKIGIEIEQLN